MVAMLGEKIGEESGKTLILVSVLAPAEWNPDASSYEIMLTQPILSRPSTKRIVISIHVDSLHAVLKDFDNAQFQIEHVYDY